MTDPRIHERRVEVAREQGRRRMRLVFAAVVLAGLGAGAFSLVHSSLLGARHVRVTGDVHTGYLTVVRAAGLTGAPPLVDLSAPAIEQRLEDLPWVERAHVAISWPDVVAISVTERTPVAAVELPGRTFAICDPTGRVLEDAATRPAGLPLVVVPGSVPAPGGLLRGAGVALTSAAAAMPQSMVATVTVLEATANGVVAVLPGGIEAQFGSAEASGQKWVSLATVLAHATLTGIGTIDLRVPAAPVLIRKGSSPTVSRNVGG